MTRRWWSLGFLFGVVIGGASFAHGACEVTDRHVYCGQPSHDALLLRQGYVLAYDHERLVPKWVAYRVEPEYRNTPIRQGVFARYRTDPDFVDPVVDTDYDGLFDANVGNFARGHLAPYAVMGGDRDGDGQYASLDETENDPEDAQTLFEANYMSNMAPQHHYQFNGPGGLWFKVERWIQDDLVKTGGRSAWVFAGTLFGSGPAEWEVSAKGIAVPPVFWKIVIEETFTPEEPRVLAFLLPHQRVSHGDLTDYLVSVDIIEQLTGLNFFSDLSEAQQEQIERTDTCANWNAYFNTWWPFTWGCR